MITQGAQSGQWGVGKCWEIACERKESKEKAVTRGAHNIIANKSREWRELVEVAKRICMASLHEVFIRLFQSLLVC